MLCLLNNFVYRHQIIFIIVLLYSREITLMNFISPIENNINCVCQMSNLVGNNPEWLTTYVKMPTYAVKMFNRFNFIHKTKYAINWFGLTRAKTKLKNNINIKKKTYFNVNYENWSCCHIFRFISLKVNFLKSEFSCL